MVFKKILKQVAMITFSVMVLITIAVFIYMQQPQFGKAPNGKRLERLKQSPNFKDGKFQNLSPTPRLAEGYSYTKVMYEFFFQDKEKRRPVQNIPSVKTDLKSLPAQTDLVIWFGHSSYLLQVEGKKILVDPVLSGYAAPFSGMNKAFNGSNIYSVDDLPYIDYLLISHDHYDHLDYETIKKLKGKVGTVITGLGVGAHFESWGFTPAQIIEKDWWEKVVLDNRLTVHLTPARHYSGRGLKASNTLWTSYVVETPSKKVFLGGDSGYDGHFAAIGKKFGGFDLAILDNGQYNPAWRNIHTPPEDVLQASKDLNAKRILPVHSSKFDLALHSWDEPLVKLTELSGKANVPLVTPMIGQTVDLNDSTQTFKKWWQGLN